MSLALQSYEVIASLTAAVNMAQPHYPNVLAWSKKLPEGNVQLQQQMLQYAVPMYNLAWCTSRSVSVGVCRFFSQCLKLHNCFPHKRFRRWNRNALQWMLCQNFLSCILPLWESQARTPQYVTATEGISTTYSPLRFWKGHAFLLPAWAAAVWKVVQPSSATSERVFSLLNNSFSHQQNGALQDYMETSIMMQYNMRMH